MKLKNNNNDIYSYNYYKYSYNEQSYYLYNNYSEIEGIFIRFIEYLPFLIRLIYDYYLLDYD